jgi:hypothetical protein
MLEESGEGDSREFRFGTVQGVPMQSPAQWIKLVASILLVAAILLPLSRCAQEAPPKVAGPSQAAPSAPDHPKTYRYYYAWTDLHSTQPWGWLFLLVFFWPAAFLAHERFGRSDGAKNVLLWMEPPLALASGYAIYLRTFLRELWVGGYLAYVGLALILVASVGQLWVRVRSWRSKE